MSKFGKYYELHIQKRVKQTGFSNGVATYDAGEYLIIKLPLSVEFSITRNAYASANQANIKIYNLAPQTRAEIFRDRYHYFVPNANISETNQPRDVRLFMGYESESSSPSLLFRGQAFYAHSQRRNADFITELECCDPAIYQYAAVSNVSIPKAAVATKTKGDMIAQFVNDMYGGLPLKTIISPTVQSSLYAPTANPQRGIARVKSAMDLAKETMTDSEGHKNFFIDNGVAIAIGFDEAFVNTALTEITPDAGLLNIPIKSENLVTAQLLMEPRLLIGQALKVSGYHDTEYNDNYKVVGIAHTGMISSTHDSPTTTSVTLFNGKPIESFTVA